ncbi:hypothetical protein [Clostridium sp. C8-1-8]|nr:hypothetical protein [Clostridium sp. C8-1-8]
MISSLLMKQIAKLFLITAMGFVLVKTRLMKVKESKSRYLSNNALRYY